MRAHGRPEPLVRLEVSLNLCVVQQGGAITWREASSKDTDQQEREGDQLPRTDPEYSLCSRLSDHWEHLDSGQKNAAGLQLHRFSSSETTRVKKKGFATRSLTAAVNFRLLLLEFKDSVIESDFWINK